MKQLCRYFLVVCAPLWAQQISPTINEVPSREFGHPRLVSFPLTSSAPNLVEGREFNGPSSIAFDTTVSPPIVYVADTFNNRVLAWQNSSGLTKGDFANKVIGQRDMYSTLAQGPGTALSTGLSAPTAVAVDSKGNLCVADAGNNRIVRYPAPFSQTGDLLQVDLVIGQKTVSSGNASNEGQPAPTEKTLSFSVNGQAYRTGLTFDAAGNLWVSDPANNRVLRFPLANLGANTQEPAADLVLGQFDFISNGPPQPQNAKQTNKLNLIQPSGLVFDQAGRLYVADGYSRVLQFTTFSNGTQAARVLGIPSSSPGAPAVTYPNGFSLGVFNSSGQLISPPPEGVFTIGNNVYVCDTGAHRVVRYDVPENWPPETTTQPSPPILSVIGQLDFTSGKSNRGLKEPDATSLNAPVSGAFSGADIWLADTFNHRVLSFPQNAAAATRVIGQLDFAFNTVNLIEGREVFLNSSSLFSGGGMVVDQNSNPPHLYIADTMNNRVLGFNDARSVKPGDRADLVIGQVDFNRSWVNYPSGDAQVPTDSGLMRPVGLVVDVDGNLLVADSGNGRVLRFPAPFAQSQGVLQHANLVLGQSSFTTQIKDASSQNMNTPFGLALFSDGSLAVSDSVHNRVLVFRRTATTDFTNGQAAAAVLGQQDFISIAAGNTSTRSGMNGPRHIASDTSDRLYVCDQSNSRVMIFTSARTSQSGAPAATTIDNLNQPWGVAVSPNTGEFWVALSNSNLVWRYPAFETLILQNPVQFNGQIAAAAPLALALDKFDNVIAAEGTNRITFYFPKLTFQHAASYNQSPMAPGMLAFLYRLGKDFNLAPEDGTGFSPWPTTLSDLQVLVAGTPAPIFHVNTTRIDFQVPMSAPQSGNADFLVIRPSTGQILGTAALPMGQANPGFFSANRLGSGQVAAVNEDGTINGPSNPVGRGKYISFYLTGQGLVSNAPPDGMAPDAPIATPQLPRIVIGASLINDSDIQYSGLGAFAGGWQINVKVPEATPPGSNIPVALSYLDQASNVGPFPGQKIQTVISVK